MEKQIYDADYFIKKFKAIGRLDANSHGCAYFHTGIKMSCNVTQNEETRALSYLFNLLDIELSGNCDFYGCSSRVIRINDIGGKGDAFYGNSYTHHPYQHLDTPLERILAALEDIKAVTMGSSPWSEPVKPAPEPDIEKKEEEVPEQEVEKEEVEVGTTTVEELIGQPEEVMV